MARETRPPPSSGLPGRLPGLGRRRVIAMKGDPTRGAAEAAPTAPHATQPVDHDRSYPARFWGGLAARIWDVRRARVAISPHARRVMPWRPSHRRMTGALATATRRCKRKSSWSSIRVESTNRFKVSILKGKPRKQLI